MPDTTSKPLLVFLNYAAALDEARATMSLLRSQDLWVDYLTGTQTPRPNYFKVMQIFLDRDFSLDVFWYRSRKIQHPSNDPIFAQWLGHAKDVVDDLSELFPASRFSYLDNTLANSDFALTATPFVEGDQADGAWPDAALAYLDIKGSIEVLSDLLTDDILDDLGKPQSSTQRPAPIKGSTLSENFPFICARLRECLGEQRFALWLGSLRFEDFDGECLRVSAPNTFLRNAIATHLARDILLISKSTCADVRRVEVVLRPKGRHKRRGVLSDWQRATVKSFSRARDWGVLSRGKAKPDIIVDAAVFRRLGLTELYPGQTFQVRWRKVDGRLIAVELRSDPNETTAPGTQTR